MQGKCPEIAERIERRACTSRKGQRRRWHNRRGPRTDPDGLLVLAGFWFAVMAARLVHLPDRSARLLVERDEESAFARTEIEDAKAAIKDRLSAVSPDVCLPAKVPMPKFVAVEIVAVQPF